MFKLFITQKTYDSISDALGMSRILLESPIEIELDDSEQIPSWNKDKKGLQEAWNKGIKMPPVSDERRLKSSLALKGKTYEEIYGKEKAEEIKRKRSEKFKEIRNKIEPWNKGKKCPILSSSAKNRPPVSAETRMKQSIAAKNRKLKNLDPTLSL